MLKILPCPVTCCKDELGVFSNTRMASSFTVLSMSVVFIKKRFGMSGNFTCFVQYADF